MATLFKKLRAQKGYSHGKVARLADFSLNTIIRTDSGVNKKSISKTLTTLARAL